MLKKLLLQNKERDMTQLPSIFSQLKELDKFFVGFDDQFNRLQKLHDDLTKNIPSYPPYNIRKTGENTYVVEMAVAGFGQSEIDIEIDGDKLIIRGNVSAENESSDYVFKGIAARAFTRSFAIDDKVEVKGAELFNGMLKIALERMVPEEKKPKKIQVKAKGQKTLLNEEEA
jgi:molecular chaperone IbpA